MLAHESSGEHLDEEALQLLKSSDEARIHYALNPGCVATPDVIRILDVLEKLRTLPKSIKNRNLVIIGESGTGKTTLLQEFRNRHPRSDDGDAARQSVVYCETPSIPNAGAVLNKILEALGQKAQSGLLEARDRLICHTIELCQIDILIFDEAQHALQLGKHGRRQFLNILKSIQNQTGVRIVAVGTHEALELFRQDPQIERRFEVEFVNKLVYDALLLEIVAGIERMLPLRLPSKLAKSEALVETLYKKSRATIGGLVSALGRATELAILSGAERITEDILNTVKVQYVIDGALRQSAR